MKNKLRLHIKHVVKPLQIVALLALLSPALSAKSGPVGDIILLGTVERSGEKLSNDTTLFEGDSIRTSKGSGGVIRIAHGRVEVGESSTLEIARENPLKIVVKTGSIAFNFPKGTDVEIVTPKLNVRPKVGDDRLSGIVTSTPQKEDRVESRNGTFTVLETGSKNPSNTIRAGQVLVASLKPVAATRNVSAAFATPQGPLGGAQIATLVRVDGDVRVARAATPNMRARITNSGLPLSNGDLVQTLNGTADITFADQSQITLNLGTIVTISEHPTPNGILRRIEQAIGNLWFNIQKGTGTQTELTTPTAVAAIRGTQGTQDVPNPNQSTHSLNEGIELITEMVTQQSVTIRTGQSVTAIRGVGFTPIIALVAAIPRPGGIGAGGGAAPGGAAGGATGGATGGVAGSAAGGAAAGGATAAAGAATTTVTTVATVTAAAATAGTLATAAIVPIAAREEQPRASTSVPVPLNPPGGGL